MAQFLLLCGLMLAAGGLVGCANHWIWQRRGGKSAGLLINLLIGVGGAFLLPIVLTHASEELLANSAGSWFGGLRFFSLALASAMASVSLFATLPILLDWRLDLSPGGVLGRFPLLPTTASAAAEAPRLSTDSQRLLTALVRGQYPYRALKGLSRELGSAPEATRGRLDQLVADGFAEVAETPKGKRWCASERGRQHVDA